MLYILFSGYGIMACYLLLISEHSLNVFHCCFINVCLLNKHTGIVAVILIYVYCVYVSTFCLTVCVK